jgi:hypothetical protein
LNPFSQQIFLPELSAAATGLPSEPGSDCDDACVAQNVNCEDNAEYNVRDHAFARV